MKKKIGSSKPMKKYVDGGPIDPGSAGPNAKSNPSGMRKPIPPAPNPKTATYTPAGTTPPKKIIGTDPTKAKYGGAVKKSSKKK